MFFSSRKKAELEEAKKREQRQIQEEKEQERQRFIEAYKENEKTFYRICDMVRSLPKKRHIVVVQRENVFKSTYERNEAYREIARRLHYKHESKGKMWLSDFGENKDALYAFYEPTKFNIEFAVAIWRFSEGAHRIRRIRYYSRNL